jgi:F0F1-type ATP synthase membrane subunit a
MKNAEKENTTYENVKEFIQSLKKDGNRKEMKKFLNLICCIFQFIMLIDLTADFQYFQFSWILFLSPSLSLFSAFSVS